MTHRDRVPGALLVRKWVGDRDELILILSTNSACRICHVLDDDEDDIPGRLAVCLPRRLEGAHLVCPAPGTGSP